MSRSSSLPRQRPAGRGMLRAALPLAAILLATTAGYSPVSAQTATAPKPPAKPALAKPAPKPPAKPAATRQTAKPVIQPAARPTQARAVDPVTTGAMLGGASLFNNSGNLGEMRRAVGLVEKGQTAEALSIADSLRDPGQQALIRWLALRVTARDVGFDRASAILRAHPSLPTPIVLRRRLEYLLYVENKSPETTLAFFAELRPYSGEGKIALARALFARGDNKAGTAWLKDAWHEDSLSEDVEARTLSEFGTLLTRADHKRRADAMLYNEDAPRGLRAAQRAGADVTALARARIALFSKGAGDPAKLLAAVPASLRSDPAFYYAQAKVARRNDNNAAALRALTAAPKDPAALIDTDEWWIERRLMARRLLDANDPMSAYKVVRDGARPENEHYIADQHFMAGWIALRFLNDPRTAQQHFARVAEGQTHPATVSRGFYWQGRALEAQGSTAKARSQYEIAAGYGTAYYGQLALARLGKADVVVRGAPQANAAQRAAFSRDEGVQIFRLLERIDKSALSLALAYDLAERLPDAAQLGLLAEISRQNGDPRAMTTIGKIALNRGMPLEVEAFPTIGIPKYRPIAEPVDPALVYAITRQESMFHSSAVSSAGAGGLMQVMPATGRTISNRTGVKLDTAKLRSDPATNVQFGAAELRSLLDNYHDNYILTFAGYNAGRGNVSKWIAAYGDPRDPNVDPIDWVERIPFSETRNYVQRVMENAQVYKSRFGSRKTLQIEADLRGARM